ncbi:hypothetical protein CRUP_018559 [Coryphaenoides rupestris]|nr:hypothetical protein CRUP_018559 [Coryphaenoides rupestris]
MTSITSREQEGSCTRFCQYVEDNSLRIYDALVIQNASDIAREHDRVRNETNWAYLQEKHQNKRWIGDDVTMVTETSYSGKHFRMGFMTMPASQDRLQCFSVRSQSLHSVGGGEDDTDDQKHPPPKPKRDPNTKLSISSEAVNGGAGNAKTTHDSLELQEVRGKFQKMPPPKPKRNPNTQLSSSFDESYIFCNHGNKKSPLLKDKCSTSRETEEEEPVYIEMVGNVLREALEDNQNVTRLPMLEHVGAPAETPQRSSHHRKSKDRERDTITPSGRSSAPPLASNLYNSAGSSHSGQSYPRSHSACPSPVSMGRCLTPLNLKHPPPYDSLMAGGSKSLDGAMIFNNSSSANSSLQNVSTRSRTPTSPSEELSSLLTSGRHMTNKGSGGRKGREGDGDARSETRPEERERAGIISSQDIQLDSSSSSSHAPNRMGRSSVSSTMLLGGVESRTGCKVGRSASTSGVPSPGVTPQRSVPHPALSQMPWVCGDATMMEVIQKKRVLCGEIRCLQGPEKNLHWSDQHFDL